MELIVCDDHRATSLFLPYHPRKREGGERKREERERRTEKDTGGRSEGLTRKEYGSITFPADREVFDAADSLRVRHPPQFFQRRNRVIFGARELNPGRVRRHGG